MPIHFECQCQWQKSREETRSWTFLDSLQVDFLSVDISKRLWSLLIVVQSRRPTSCSFFFLLTAFETTLFVTVVYSRCTRSKNATEQ